MSARLERARRQTASLSYRAFRAVAHHSPLRRFVSYRYEFMFSPRDLAFLGSCLEATASLPGPIVEIGCAGGRTTVFLNKYLDDLGADRRYVCIDTFAGFTATDLDAERRRGHTTVHYEHAFAEYSEKQFLRTLRSNAVHRPEVVKVDVHEFDFSSLSDISFCLVDVDLYRPVRHALEQVVPRLAKGGLVVVDDCTPDGVYKGAREAYLEFTRDHGLPADIRNGSMGVIGDVERRR